MTMDYSTTTTTAAIIAQPFASATQPLDRDIKHQYKCVYNLLKQFDQEKQKINSIDGIFDARIENLRSSIVEQSTALIYQTEFEVIGRKCREILWFKGYYDLISLAKRLWKKNQTNDKQAEEQISNLIIEGISHFKLIIVNLERKFSLDLRDVVDFSFLDSYEKNLYTAVASQNSICHNENRSRDEVTKYAMETIHALLISLGDLHRYFIDFDFTMPKISKDFVANYYFEAFKLNPKSGMAQNQLGTLLAGSNYNLDSIYHYLYSLVCPVPFEVSDSRCLMLFQSNASYLEKTEGANDKGDTIGLRDFIARYLLVIDVFFYDKDINDFNSLCHCMLLDFRKMLQSNRIELSGDILFKMVAMFFFCMIKLKTIGSNKIHSLHAFLVALCAELVSACSTKLNKFIASREAQNAKFQTKYYKHFEEFEQTVRDARNKHKRYVESMASSASHTNDESNDAVSIKSHVNGKFSLNKLSDESGGLKNGRKFSLNEHEDMATNSSGRERESDAGKSTPMSSQTKNVKRRGNLRRRRRRMVSVNSNSDLSYFEDSECDMDTDFSSDNDSADENDDSWCSSGSDEDELDSKEPVNGVVMKNNHVELNNGVDHDDDDEDVVIEDEQIIYPNNGIEVDPKHVNGKTPYENSIFGDFMSSFKQLQLYDEENKNGQNHFAFEQSNPFNFKFNLIDNVENTLCNDEDLAALSTNPAPEKLRFKQKYNKVDPNIIIEFFQHENTMIALKLLFDWLRGNNGIIVNCFTTNPEFIDKIFDLLNIMNIDIFTRKVYFERFYIETENVRENLRSLFDVRQTVPLKEDVLLKECSVFDVCQRHMDWTLPLKLKISETEETILRIFLFVDFGFSLCKMKKFDYNFCSRTRNFIKIATAKHRAGKRIRKRGRRNRRRVRNRSRNRKSSQSELSVLSRNGEHLGRSSPDDIQQHDSDEKKSNLKKGYLRNRQQNHQVTASTGTNEKVAPVSASQKHQLMGKLWLKHEIEVLEAKMSKNSVILTPYLVVDSKVLSKHLEIVKKLVKAKKFVVLIPSAVLAELDELKKTSDVVRNTIRWLEREFTNGSRFIRLQRNNEIKPLTLIKVPKKLDREASTFMHIAQFCNFINETHTANGENILGDSMAKPNVVTFLTGDRLIDNKLSNISFTGILDAIGVNFEQINEFYGKYKKK